MPRRPLVQADYVKRHALMLPEVARYDYILGLPKDRNLGEALVAAMKAIETAFEPLQGVLPKDYGIFERAVLEPHLARLAGDGAMRRKLAAGHGNHESVNISRHESPPRRMSRRLMSRSVECCDRTVEIRSPVAEHEPVVAQLLDFGEIEGGGQHRIAFLAGFRHFCAGGVSDERRAVEADPEPLGILQRALEPKAV